MSNTAPFLHIAYANNNTGTLDFTTTGGVERTYTGFYTDEYATDSSDPTKYKWLTNAEFKNKVNTAAYANSADGKDGFTTVYPNMPSSSEVKDSDYPQYIGFSNVINPTSFKDYEWTLLENIPKKILNTHVAYANSSDGITDFTTVYPNLNVLKGTKTSKSITGNNTENQQSLLYSFDNDKSLAEQGFNINDTLTLEFDWSATNPASGQFNLQWQGDPWIFNIPSINIYPTNGSGHVVYTFNIRDIDIASTAVATGLGYRLDYVPTNTVVTFSNVIIRKAKGSQPWMPSSSEVKDSDYPKFVGVYGDNSTTASKVPAVYSWSSIPTPGPIPPIVNNLYVLTMPTVKSINLSYGIGTLTTKPIAWLSTKPKVDVNQVLWYKSEITGTDNSVGVYYSNLVGGANLDDGDSPLDNTLVSIVLNDKPINIPRDLALKLELLSQTSNKRDDELAQLIADTNDRITNIDLTSGQQGLIQEISDRKAGDAALDTKIETTNGNLSDLKTNVETELANVEKQIGGFLIQGTKNISMNRPAIVFDYNSYGKALPDGSTDGGGRLNFQVPGDATYVMRELKFDYKTVPSFYDLDQIMIWENSWSQLYGGFSWRDTIITTTDIDRFYIDGMTSYYDSNGDIVIRGKVVLDGVDDWIGQMNNRGFRPDSVVITIAKDLKSIKLMRFVGAMGTIIMNINLGYGATSNTQRLGRRISFIGVSPKNTLTTTNSWIKLNEKIPYGMRPTNTIEVSIGLLSTNNIVCYNFTTDSGIRIFQSSNNANQYQLMGQVGWETFDQYPPINYSSNSGWKNR